MGEPVDIKRVHWIQAKHHLGLRNVLYISLLFHFLAFCHGQMHQQSFNKFPSIFRLAAQVCRPMGAGLFE